MIKKCKRKLRKNIKIKCKICNGRGYLTFVMPIQKVLQVKDCPLCEGKGWCLYELQDDRRYHFKSITAEELKR